MNANFTAALVCDVRTSVHDAIERLQHARGQAPNGSDLAIALDAKLKELSVVDSDLGMIEFDLDEGEYNEEGEYVG